MRRLVLVLGLAVLGWLGRRELRSAADAQRYLTLLALLQVVAVTGRTASSAKYTGYPDPDRTLTSSTCPAQSTATTSRNRSLLLVEVIPTVVNAAVWSSAMSRAGSVTSPRLMTPFAIGGTSADGVSVRTTLAAVDGPDG